MGTGGLWDKLPKSFAQRVLSQRGDVQSDLFRSSSRNLDLHLFRAPYLVNRPGRPSPCDAVARIAAEFSMNRYDKHSSPRGDAAMTDSSEQLAGQNDAPRRPWGVWIAGALLLLTGLAQGVAPATDRQIANIASAALLLAALVSLAVWWVRRWRASPWVRWTPLVAFSLAAAAAAVVWKPIGVSGEFLPQFAYRFAERAAPPAPSRELSADGIDWSVGANDFPGFLGPNRDGRIAERRFATEWQQQPPKLRWRQPIGAGWSGIAVAGSAEAAAGGAGPFGFTLEQRGEEEWVTCYDLSDGTLIWHHAERAKHYNPLGGLGPRSTPTLSSDGRVYAQGATGVVRCLDGRDGRLVWRVDLLEVAGIDQTTSEASVTWGRAGSPLLVDDLAVVPLGGDAQSSEGVHSLIALDAATGATRWIGGDHQISYASPVLATLAGVRQILTADEASVAGHAPEDGRVLWTHGWPGSSSGSATCSNPVPVGVDQVLLSKGYGGGALLLRLSAKSAGASSAELSAEEVWKDRRVLKTKFTNVCVDGDYAYALSDGALECVHLPSGSRQWKQGRSGRFGQGQALIAGDVLVVLSEEGELALVALDPEAYRELARIQALEGKTWNPPTVVGNLFVLRNAREVAVWEATPEEDESVASAR